MPSCTENGVPFDAVTFVKITGDLPQSSGRRRANDLPFHEGESFTVYGECGFNGFVPMQFDEGLFRGAWVGERNEAVFRIIMTTLRFCFSRALPATTRFQPFLRVH